ncbi:hypothetical protein J31TS4_33940 [Paenibacillus sp. J31TS4]|uniref:hypothetical protein n=1 Tax=Paenibacillus sp. J31TS4 TaxID=2807195 RepID=UPI001B1AF10F|nr:hypothetical protein [Paenibacillus sp. J31TS4]GIP40114.1 hypothetical protein J31TS4_33940 [Paenibacillus sp. J31TS4]
MTSSRNHQEAHGIGQIEEQLARQAEAAEAIQGLNEADEDILEAASREETELDELV